MGIRRFVIAAFAAALVAVPVAQAGAPKNIFAAEARATPASRAVHIAVPQAELKTSIVDSKVAAAAGGGLLMALIDAGVEAHRAKEAEAAVQPLRSALSGYDADAKALSATNNALGQVGWFGAQPATMTKDASQQATLAALDAATTAQVALVEYEYGTSPDFGSIVVTAHVRVANHAVQESQKPEARLSTKNLAFEQKVRSVVSLPSPGTEPAANVQRWSEDQAALARQGLAAAFSEVERLLPRALNLTAEDVAAWKTIKGSTTLGGHSGKLIEESGAVSLLFDGTLISVQTLVAGK